MTRPGRPPTTKPVTAVCPAPIGIPERILSMTIDDHELVMRIPDDNVGDFGFGTNWICVIIHREDRAAGRLDRCV